MGTGDFTFANAAGERLSGRLALPDDGAPFGGPRAFALFAHCFTCNKDYKAPVFLGRELAARGIATLRFDFPGLGGSEGEFADTTLTRNVADVVAAADALARDHGAPAILMGHSMGGAAVLRAAPHMPSVRLVVTLAAPADPGLHGTALAAVHDAAMRDGEASFEVAGRQLRIRRAFFDDVERGGVDEAMARLDAHLLVVHADVDLIVPPSNADALLAAARGPRSRLTLPGAGHLFHRRADCRYIADVIAAWADRYLGDGTTAGG